MKRTMNLSEYRGIRALMRESGYNPYDTAWELGYYSYWAGERAA